MFGQYNPYNNPFMQGGAMPYMQQRFGQNMGQPQQQGAAWLDNLPADDRNRLQRFMMFGGRGPMAQMMPFLQQQPQTAGMHQGQAPMQGMQPRAPMPTGGMHQGQAPMPTGGIAQGRFPGVVG